MSRIYVSSTFNDLEECREKVRSALRKLGHEDIAMEYYVAESKRPLERCLADVDSCDLYLGIFAWRYGYVPPKYDKSITELEFRRAVETNKDCLIFLLAEGANWPTDQIEFESYAKIKALRNELSENYLAGFFSSKDDIEARVMEGVIKWHGSRARRDWTGVKPTFQAPPLPAHYIERTDAVGGIVEALLKNSTQQSGILVVSALHGLPGVGKTTLATAVAHHPIIRERFKDGILWATLGQSPDILSQLVSWVQALGDREYRPTTVTAATNYLRTLLDTAAVLTVVDDVWEVADIAPFLAGGPNCRLLITTRRAHVADQSGARLCTIEEMSPLEATALLRKRVEAGGERQSMTAVELEDAAALAEEAGYLPLALELMGALVARGYSWDDARNSLSLEQTRRGNGGSHRHRAQSKLEASLQVSLKRLRTEDREVWQCFAWLGVLPEDVSVNPQMAAVLWEMSETEARLSLNSLADEAILQRHGISFRIHDLMHDMARHLLMSQPPDGLGIHPREAQALFLSQYAKRITGGRWSELPSDGYIHSHLLWHLEQSGDTDGIHQLLSLSNSEGQHAWYAAREQLGQSAGFIADVTSAWRIARREGLHLGKQCRYGLIIASLHSLAQVISPKVLSLLVQNRIWTPSKALDCIHRMSDSTRRASSLTMLIPSLFKSDKNADNQSDGETGNLLDTLLEEAQAIIDSGIDTQSAAELLGTLTRYCEGPRQSEIADKAAALVSESPKSLIRLAKSLPANVRDRVLERACQACEQIDDSYERIRTLADMIPQFSSNHSKGKWIAILQNWTETLVAAKASLSDNDDNDGLNLSEERPWSDEVKLNDLSSADSRSNLRQDMMVLRELESAPTAADSDHVENESEGVSRKIIQYLFERGIELPQTWIQKIALMVADRDREFVIGLAQTGSVESKAKNFEPSAVDKFTRIMKTALWTDLEELLGLIPLLPRPCDEYVKELLDTYRSMRRQQLGEVFTQVAQLISPEYFNLLIIELGDTIGGQCLRANREAEPVRSNLFESMIHNLSSLTDSYNRELAMRAIARTCPADIVRHALSSLQRIDDAEEQTGTIFILAPFLPAQSDSELRDYFAAMHWNRKQIATLTNMVLELSSALKGGVLEDFVKEASRFSSEWWIVEALTLTILRIHDLERLSAILKAVNHITATDLKARLVGRLAIRMARIGETKTAIKAAESLVLLSDRWVVLADLATELAKDGLMNDAEDVAASIGNSEERSKARAAIALHLGARGDVPRAREIAQQLSIEHWRNWVQSRLDLIKDTGQTAISSGRNASSRVVEPYATDVNLDSVRQTAVELIKQGAKYPEIYKILEAAKTENIPETRKAIQRFWMAEGSDKKTYLETISEQPRPLFLKNLQDIAPLLTVCFDETDAAELVSAIQNVSTWWP